MQLSPLQSRLAASLAASLFILALYLLLLSPSLALAVELESLPPVSNLTPLTESLELDIVSLSVYEPEFSPLERRIVGRLPAGVAALENNEVQALNLKPGTSACYMLEKRVIFSASTGKDSRDVDVEGRADELAPTSNSDTDAAKKPSQDIPFKTVYLSSNTCLRPYRVASSATAPEQPPQLKIFVSNSSDIGCAFGESLGVHSKGFDQGAVMYSLNATGDLYINIVAPNVTNEFQGVYNFEVAASTDDYYHRYEERSSGQLLWMDSDSSSALLVTRNLTTDENESKHMMQQEPPYELFVENKNTLAIDGLRHSACGLGHAALIASKRLENGQLNNNNLVRTAMTTRGPGGLPKQQFYFEGLNSSSFYTGVLVKRANKTVKSSKRQVGIGGGGIVFAATDFQTSAGTNCKVVTDLEFCDEIQYAAPGNDEKFNNTVLAKVYDDYARMMYSNFEKVMMQIPCEASSTRRYSLTRNCDDCKAAYKRWLCTVSIPRCEDFSRTSDFTIERSFGRPFPNGTKLSDDLIQELSRGLATNTSRNSFIDDTINPGPYKEILPCDDLCYEVVQACPAAIGFTCPLPRMVSFGLSYGQRVDDSSAVSCNYPGEPRTRISAAGVVSPSIIFLSGALCFVALLALGS